MRAHFIAALLSLLAPACSGTEEPTIDLTPPPDAGICVCAQLERFGATCGCEHWIWAA